MSLRTRNAIVTCSSSGIGLAVARAFVKEGANVMINGLGDAAAIEAERAAIEKDFGVRSFYSPADEGGSNGRRRFCRTARPRAASAVSTKPPRTQLSPSSAIEHAENAVTRRQC
jgi:NAD(P)-dependent dehydrogenase (short-subunit alcohol dehydrogenase family)